MRRIIPIALAAILMISLVGCATTSSLTPLQRRVMESKDLEGSYEDAFRAIITVLQDKTYIIGVSDSAGGIIRARTSRLPSSKWPGATENYEAQISVEKFTDTIAKVRISIYIEIYNIIGAKFSDYGGDWGAPQLKSGLVEDPRVYQDFYAEVQKEMFRREQLNR